jgi:hypothetical protein
LDGRSIANDLAIGFVGGVACITLAWMVSASAHPGAVLLVLAGAFAAPLAISLAWWFTAVLLAVAMGMVLLAGIPMPKWLRRLGAAILSAVWIGCGLLWLGQQT